MVVPIRPPNHNHKTFIGNSETCEVLQLAVNGVAPPTRVGVGKAWEMSNMKNKSKDSWLTGIAHHDGLVYCLPAVRQKLHRGSGRGQRVEVQTQVRLAFPRPRRYRDFREIRVRHLRLG